MPEATLAISIPRPQDVDAGWLTALLRQGGQAVQLTALESEPVGTGQLGDTFRFTPQYQPGHSGPQTIIGKFAAEDAGSREIAAAWTLYKREVEFYRQVAGTAGILTPRCYAAAMAEDGQFVLLLEDCAPARAGDQFAGLSQSEAMQAMVEVARLHANTWNCDQKPGLEWLETGKMAQAFYDKTVLRKTWPAFCRRYRDMLTSDMIRVCDRFAERYENYMAPLDRPRCVTHNDYRPDNMLFKEDGTQYTVDWQSAALGYNAVDVSYLIGGAYSPEGRREVEVGLLKAYHDELCARGVSGYTLSDLEDDYRHFSYAGINVAVGAAMMVKRTERGDQMFLTMLDRHVSHVLDTGALSILD